MDRSGPRLQRPYRWSNRQLPRLSQFQMMLPLAQVPPRLHLLKRQSREAKYHLRNLPRPLSRMQSPILPSPGSQPKVTSPRKQRSLQKTTRKSPHRMMGSRAWPPNLQQWSHKPDGLHRWEERYHPRPLWWHLPELRVLPVVI